MSYAVKEIFYTLQGEGANAGRPAVFCRFSGCNLWSGREEDREKATCKFCDTDFVGINGQGGGRFHTAHDLANAVAAMWPISNDCKPFVVCTGGEPLLQLDTPLIEELHQRGFRIAVETNGTVAAPPGVDWLCVSPKSGTDLAITAGHELKLVYPQEGAEPERFTHLGFEHRFLQPKDGPSRAANTEAAISYCLSHPNWRLSIQMHKVVGIR